MYLKPTSNWLPRKEGVRVNLGEKKLHPHLFQAYFVKLTPFSPSCLLLSSLIPTPKLQLQGGHSPPFHFFLNPWAFATFHLKLNFESILAIKNRCLTPIFQATWKGKDNVSSNLPCPQANGYLVIRERLDITRLPG